VVAKNCIWQLSAAVLHSLLALEITRTLFDNQEHPFGFEQPNRALPPAFEAVNFGPPWRISAHRRAEIRFAKFKQANGLPIQFRPTQPHNGPPWAETP
jgi:hypothetical protein